MATEDSRQCFAGKPPMRLQTLLAKHGAKNQGATENSKSFEKAQ